MDKLPFADTPQHYYVDIPTKECILDDPDTGWANVGIFSTKEEAVSFIRRHIDPNCDDEGRVSLISG